ncbi:reverse transcriptase domain-containing protein, partial [Tanacetum coccineum]
MLAQVSNRGNVRNQNGNVANENVHENVRNVLVNGNRVGCSYKDFLDCNPKEYDGKGGVVVLTRWIEKMESVHDISVCSIDQKVKYTAGLFMGKALTWWNSQIRTLSREIDVSMSWNDFKFMMIQEFCPSHEMQNLESELWNHAMVRAGHAAYTDRFHELASTKPNTIQKAVQIFGALTDEAVRNGLIKKVEKRGNVGEPSKDKNGRDDNKRTMTKNAFDTTVNPIGRENMGTWPKGVPRNVNPVNARNPTFRACYECGRTDHVRSACPRMNRAQGPEENRPNQVATNNGGQGRGNQGNKARGMDWLSNYKAKIICHEKVVSDKKEEEIVVVRDFPEELAFQTLKGKFCNAHVLALPNGPKDFVLKIHEKKYTTHDLELSVVVFSLHIWRHYLYGTKSLIYTDHKSLQHIFSQKKLNMRQLRWIELFSDYDCEIRYHPGKVNVVADSLSGKERVKPKRVKSMNMTLHLSIKDRILAALKEVVDEFAGLQKVLDEMIEQRSNGTLYYLDRIWVPLKGKDWKDKKKQKRSKTDKKREKDKESRARQRIQPEITAGSARYSQTQSKKEIKEVKSLKESQRVKVVKSPKSKGLILKIGVSRTKVAKR